MHPPLPGRAPAGPAPHAVSEPPGRPARRARSARATRSDALDRLRGVALVAMLAHHLIEWQTGDARAVLPGWRAFSVTDAAAVAFFVAAGASMALFVTSRARRGVPRVRVAAQVLRRYGALVPIGLALDWVFWRNPYMFGVLEALGVTVVLGAAVAALVPRWALAPVAMAVVAAGVWSERMVEGDQRWLADEAIGGKFPLVTYLGFVLIGVVAVRTDWYASRRRMFAAAAVAVLATVVMLADGIVPARYPGDIPFVVPGLAATILAYVVGQIRWPRALAAADTVLRRAAAHTLGIFVGHYLVYGLLRRYELMGDIDAAVAVPTTVVITTALCLVAPRVPQLPWSVRTGWRRPRHTEAPVAATPECGPAVAPAPASTPAPGPLPPLAVEPATAG